MWILIALQGGPLTTVGLFDRVRRIDGPVGPGSLFAAIAHLERLALISGVVSVRGLRTYAPTEAGVTAAAAGELLLAPWGPES